MMELLGLNGGILAQASSEMMENFEPSEGLLAGGILMIAFIAFAIMLLPMIFYLLTLQKALNRCSPENRAMAPAMVWLNIIPFFGIVWHFFVVINMAKSLGAEFQQRQIEEEPEPGKKIGMIMCILACCGIIPLIGSLLSLAGFVCWIIYWVKMAGFSAKIADQQVNPAPLEEN